MKKFLKCSFLFLTGGLIYYFMEILYRGFSHYTMYICGGVCFLLIGGLDEIEGANLSLISQMIISCLIITIIELFTGIIVNRWLDLGVWDYSAKPYNFMGQINLTASIMWFFISLPAILLDDYLRYRFFGEEKPKYKIL